MSDFIIVMIASAFLIVTGFSSFGLCIASSSWTGRAYSDWAAHSIVAMLFGVIGFIVGVALEVLHIIGVIP